MDEEWRKKAMDIIKREIKYVLMSAGFAMLMTAVLILGILARL